MSGPSPMDDLIRRSAEMIAVYARDYSEEPWRQNVDAMLCFKGLALTGMPAVVDKELSSRMARMNRILARYPLETFEDYALISEQDHARIRKIMKGIAQLYG